MYSVYIIDDDPLYLQELLSKPQWLECGFEIVGYSANAVFALNEILHIAPNVVFTDLKMPNMSGTELIHVLKEKQIDTEFVLVSAYSDFEEARKFFKMDGFDYIIKPVNDQDLTSLLLDISSKFAAMNKVPFEKNALTMTVLNDILKELRENPEKKYTLESLGQKYNYNPNTICNLFSKHLNTTLTSYLLEIRMERASDMLKNTALSVKEISDACGYEYFYFCRVFRRYFKCTPTEYREKS